MRFGAADPAPPKKRATVTSRQCRATRQERSIRGLRSRQIRTVHFRAGSDCPPKVLKAARRLFDDAHEGRLNEERLGELDRFIALAAEASHELRAYDDALDFVAGRRDAIRMRGGLPGHWASPSTSFGRSCSRYCRFAAAKTSMMQR